MNDYLYNVWRIIYNDIDDKNPNLTGDEVLALAKEKFKEILNRR